MLKEIRNGLMKFFTMEKVIMIIALVILAYMLFSYGNNKGLVMDSMSNYATVGDVYDDKKQESGEEKSVAPMKPSVVSGPASPEDLLPSDSNSEWSALKPTSVDKSKGIMSADLLEPVNVIGTSTGTSLGCAPNLQLRGDPTIQKQDIGPWNQSTCEGDVTRKPLE
jgi:hypothetical protein